MKIANNQIENYIKNIDSAKIAGCLLYGAEESVIKRRFSDIAKKIVDDLSDDFLVSNISKERLSNDKSAIYDEFFSISMIGGRKLITIKEVDSNVSQIIKSLDEEKNLLSKSNNFILINGGDLDKNSAIRKIIERSPYFAALPCYEDSEFFVKKIISDSLNSYNIQYNSQIIDAIMQNSNKNTEIALQEIEKIAIYLDGKRDIKIDDLLKIIGLDQEVSVSSLINNFIKKDVDASIIDLEKLVKQGVEIIAIIRMMASYLQKLYFAKLQINNDLSNLSEVVRLQNIFFKDEDSFVKNLKLVNMDFLQKELKKIAILETKIKSQNISARLLFTDFIRCSIF